MEATADPMVVYDTQGQVTFVNPAFTRVFGWSDEELIGQRVPFVPEENREETMIQVRRVLGGVPISAFETRRLTRDGAIIDARVSAALIQDTSGAAVGMVVTLQDITAVKQAEQALRRETAKLSTMIAGMDQGVVFADASDRVVEANDFFCRFRGIRRDQIIGQPLHRFHDEATAKGVSGMIATFRRNPDANPVVIQRTAGDTEAVFRVQPIYRDGVL